jgi:hypothetical protein
MLCQCNCLLLCLSQCNFSTRKASGLHQRNSVVVVKKTFAVATTAFSYHTTSVGINHEVFLVLLLLLLVTVDIQEIGHGNNSLTSHRLVSTHHADDTKVYMPDLQEDTVKHVLERSFSLVRLLGSM